MFKFTKQNNSQSYDEKSYKNFLENLLVDKEIKEEILNQVDYFINDGKITFDGNNLYGKIINKKGNDYFEIRYQNQYLVCNYTKWNGRSITNITQIDLKNNNIKVDRKEKTEYICPDNKNETDIEELEKIYDLENKLLYTSSLKRSYDYDSLDKNLVYKNDSFWSNNFELEKNWYISNGSIIKYNLSKHYLYDNSQLEESYSICPGVCISDFGRYYNFVNLDENLFKLFITGQITIQQLLEQNNQTENNKTKEK